MKASKVFLLNLFFTANIILQTYAQVGHNKTARHFDKLGTGQANNFISFFSDSVLAEFVAEKLNKKITDHVTTEELASIKGDFDIGGRLISNLNGIGYLTGIDSFHCYKNYVTEIPAEIGKLTNLRYLDLCKAFELKKLPKEIGELRNLKMIRLCLTEVSRIPKEIGNLSQLEILWIFTNNLTEIPKEIGNLKKLVDLDIHSNKISYVPKEICKLTSLTSLNMSHCGLKQIPGGIGNLKNLKTLNLFGNDLKYLPESIEDLDKLSYLNVYDNFKLSESYKSNLPKLLRKKK